MVFARALEDMFPLAKAILAAALRRDECRGAHYKPEFAMPDLAAVRPGRAAPRRLRYGATALRRTIANGSRRRSPAAAPTASRR